MTSPTEKPNVSDIGASYVRTAAMLIAGSFVTWLARRAHIVLDAGSSQAAVMVTTGVLSGAYYVVVRFLESKWKGFGWFLGLARQPKYVDPDATKQSRYLRRDA